MFLLKWTGLSLSVIPGVIISPIFLLALMSAGYMYAGRLDWYDVDC